MKEILPNTFADYIFDVANINVLDILLTKKYWKQNDNVIYTFTTKI